MASNECILMTLPVDNKSTNYGFLLIHMELLDSTIKRIEWWHAQGSAVSGFLSSEFVCTSALGLDWLIRGGDDTTETVRVTNFTEIKVNIKMRNGLACATLSYLNKRTDKCEMKVRFYGIYTDIFVLSLYEKLLHILRAVYHNHEISNNCYEIFLQLQGSVMEMLSSLFRNPRNQTLALEENDGHV